MGWLSLVLTLQLSYVAIAVSFVHGRAIGERRRAASLVAAGLPANAPQLAGIGLVSYHRHHVHFDGGRKSDICQCSFPEGPDELDVRGLREPRFAPPWSWRWTEAPALGDVRRAIFWLWTAP